jgi:hypothetical protein
MSACGTLRSWAKKCDLGIVPKLCPTAKNRKAKEGIKRIARGWAAFRLKHSESRAGQGFWWVRKKKNGPGYQGLEIRCSIRLSYAPL